MSVAITKSDALRVVTQLLNSPIAPGAYSRFINVGTDHILDALEENYFRGVLAQGISCFKYLEGDYGSGKTQFILSLAARAQASDVVTAVVNIGSECPFNSQHAIFKAVMESFLPPMDEVARPEEGRGIERLFQDWISRKLRSLGVQPGQEVPEIVRRQVERSFGQLFIGAPDPQMATALNLLGRRLLDIECGASFSVTDQDLISWVRGDTIRSKALKDAGLHEPTKDENAFRRLKATIAFLRRNLGYRGFFIAFDEGTRTSSFRRGSAKQRQAIENMLTMINENADGQFGGVMFLYAATPDFRSDVISKYTALNDRIGSVAFSVGSPLVPLIDLEAQNTDEVTRQIGERLLTLFEEANGVTWDRNIQGQNMDLLIEAQKDVLMFLDKVPPRVFVYQYCRFLSQQLHNQRLIGEDAARSFVEANDLPTGEDEE